MKLNPLLLSAALIFALAACSEGEKQPQTAASGTVHLGNLLGLGGDVFVKRYTGHLNQSVSAAAAEVSLSVEESREAGVQLQQAEKWAADPQIDVLLARMPQPNAENAAALIARAKAAKKPIIFYNRDPGKAVIETYEQAYFVGSVPAQSGIMQGELIVKGWLKNPDWDKNRDGIIQYAILKGRNGFADAEERTKWVAATIQNYPSHNVRAEEVFLENADWQTDKAEEVVTRWLASEKGQTIEVIIANNDAMAVGALAATKKHHLKLPIFGVDANPDVLEFIRQKEIAGSVLQDTEKQAGSLVALAKNLGQHKTKVDAGIPYKVVEQYLMIPYVPVDESNVNDF